jgi:hypothetical protein
MKRDGKLIELLHFGAISAQSVWCRCSRRLFHLALNY